MVDIFKWPADGAPVPNFTSVPNTRLMTTFSCAGYVDHHQKKTYADVL